MLKSLKNMSGPTPVPVRIYNRMKASDNSPADLQEKWVAPRCLGRVRSGGGGKDISVFFLQESLPETLRGHLGLV